MEEPGYGFTGYFGKNKKIGSGFGDRMEPRELAGGPKRVCMLFFLYLTASDASIAIFLERNPNTCRLDTSKRC